MGAVVRGAACPQVPGVLLLPEPPSQTPARQLVEQALSEARLLSGPALPARLVLVSGSWRLDVRELRGLTALLADQGVRLAGVCGLDPRTRVAAAALGLATSTPAEEPSGGSTAAAFDAAASPGGSRLSVHQGTVRSGDHLEAEGSLLVLGDVNPGGRISAAGHVLVWGRLRGMAHAGCRGDRAARIVALQLRPLQLRIADAVARGPEELPPAGLAEQAVLLDGEIQLQAAPPAWPLSD